MNGLIANRFSVISSRQIPDNYSVLFMQSGGTGQFSAVPMNLLESENGHADYLVTGVWSNKASSEAQKYGQIHKFEYSNALDIEDISFHKDSKYLYMCTNETIDGFEIHELPSNIPSESVLVADMSSNFLSKPIDVSKYGLIYAGAQKNAGIAGLVFVIIRKDLLKRKCFPSTPSCLSYELCDKGDSLVNTPPTFAIFVSGLVFQWIKEQGGLSVIEERNKIKSQTLYNYIDNSNGFYNNTVPKSYRSRMNITFRLKTGDEQLEKQFVKEAEDQGMLNLAGHRSVGGIRASIYNGITVDDVHKLIEFMETFKSKHLIIP